MNCDCKKSAQGYLPVKSDYFKILNVKKNFYRKTVTKYYTSESNLPVKLVCA